jgi:hypothetical protein
VAGQFTISGMAAGSLTGERIFGPYTITGSLTTIGQTTDIVLSSGDNTIAVPTGALAVWVFPPNNNSAALKIRTNLNSSDAGLPISPSQPFGPYVFASGTTSLIINAGAGVSAFTEVAFI